MTGRTDLSRFDNAWYIPGRSLPVRLAWMLVNGLFFLTWLPWPSAFRVTLLRLFGAEIGRGVVIKPRVNVKYPWNLRVGDFTWIGEGAWIDSLAEVRIGSNACLSQGCMVETGNHDWSRPTFDLLLRPVVIEDGAWAAVGSLLLPGARLADHAVLGAGSVLAGSTEPYSVYAGVPAVRVRARTLSDTQ